MTIRIDGTNTAANPGITGTDTDTGLQFGTDEVNIVTGGTTAVTVDSSQRVGIGAASPFGPLHVRMGTNQNIYFTSGIGEIGNVPGFQGINDDGSALTSIGMRGTDIRFATGSSERVRILSSGGITFNGDTAATNALDDYEEGTFVPVLRGSSTAGTTADGVGTYVKVGGLVHFQVRFTNVSISGGTGTIVIYDMPFNVHAADDKHPVFHCMMHNVTFDSSKTQNWYGSHNENRLYGLQNSSGSSWTAWSYGDFDNGAIYLNVSGTYYTTQ